MLADTRYRDAKAVMTAVWALALKLLTVKPAREICCLTAVGLAAGVGLALVGAVVALVGAVVALLGEAVVLLVGGTVAPYDA